MAKCKVDLSKEAQDVLDKAFLDGFLVILSIGKKSWTTTLTPKMMGLEEFPKNWKAGRCLLLPEEQLAKINFIEGAARRYLDKQSFAFGRHSRANFRFVPKFQFNETANHLEELQRDFFAALDLLLAEFSSMRDKMKATYPEQWPLIEKYYDIDEKEIRADYYFSIEPLKMMFPESVGEVDVEAEIREKNLEGRLAEEYRRKAEDRLQRITDEAKQTAVGFIEDAMRSLRGQVVLAFQDIGDKIQSGKELNKSNIDKIKKSIDYVLKMDFLGDTEFKAKLSDVKNMVDGVSSFKDNEQAVHALGNMLKKTVDFVSQTTDSTVAATTKAYFKRNLQLD